MEKERKKGKRRIRIVILILLLAVFVTSTTFVVIWLLDAARVRNEMDDLRAMIRTEGTEKAAGDTTKEAAKETAEPGSSAGPDSESGSENAETAEQTEDPVPAGFDREAFFKYQAIYELNPDFVGWLRIPDTAVDYPVLRREGETEYYLWRNIREENDDHGIPYMDGFSVIGESDNLYIYGHHKRDGTMFFDLEKFRDENYYRSRKYIYFETLSRGMEVYEVAVTFMVDVHNDPFHFHQYYNFTPESFEEFYREVKARQLYETDTDIEYGDELLTLVTCERVFSEIGRFVLIARRIR